MPPTSGMEPHEIVEKFVNAINAGHAAAVVSAMGRDPVFIDSLGVEISGKNALLAGWRAYYQLFPDYRIEVEAMMVDGQNVLLRGWAGGTLHRDGRAIEGSSWRIPAAWRAVTDSRRVMLWQVFADNKPVYALLER